MKTIIAVDPGICGGIAVMRQGKILTMALKKTPEAEQIAFLRAHSVDSVAYVEKVGGFIPKGEDGEGQPGSRMFTFGESYGRLCGIIDTLGIKRVNVLPQMWQRGIPGRGGTYSERKRALHDHAAKLFPNLAVTPDIADALGILHYARFQEGGQNAGYGGKPSVAKRVLPPMAEQFVLADAWCKRCGWPVPAKGTPERSAMVDHWANGWLNAEPGF